MYAGRGPSPLMSEKKAQSGKYANKETTCFVSIAENQEKLGETIWQQVGGANEGQSRNRKKRGGDV